MPKSLCLVLKTKCHQQILILKNNPKHFYGQGKVLHSVLMKGLWWWCLVMKLCPTLCTPWTVTCQASLSMGFPRQEYWSGLPFLSPGGLPDPGIQCIAGEFFTTEPPGKPYYLLLYVLLLSFYTQMYHMFDKTMHLHSKTHSRPDLGQLLCS